ncbi:MAG TPA: isoprenylcysteine carboxylmethyltransferase family protein [Lichenihabitans sp.]|jgi:methyltransferase|nr:isoprenylcysteine carboxylmethyltransferase family protein [Lichenihabitans sp.]
MLAPLILAAVTAERLAELALARRNTRALKARGAWEAAPAHYRVIVIVHAAWLVCLWTWGRNAVAPEWLGAFLALQVLRTWVLATLGRRWTTRIIILPGAPLVSTGPYRILPHPNYVIVIGEIASLPLALGLPAVAAAFTILNLLILSVRVRAENKALATVR